MGTEKVPMIGYAGSADGDGQVVRPESTATDAGLMDRADLDEEWLDQIPTNRMSSHLMQVLQNVMKLAYPDEAHSRPKIRALRGQLVSEVHGLPVLGKYVKVIGVLEEAVVCTLQAKQPRTRSRFEALKSHAIPERALVFGINPHHSLAENLDELLSMLQSRAEKPITFDAPEGDWSDPEPGDPSGQKETA